MAWLNPYGLVFMALIMLPNIVSAIACKDEFENRYQNKAVLVLEQIGRYGCFFTMICNVPFTVFGFRSDEAFAAYLIVDAVLIAAYCAIWIICFRKNSYFKALALSILPSVVFLFSGVVSRSVLLCVFAAIFAPCHIRISEQNVRLRK